MGELRVLCRVVTYDPLTKSILLVRNKDQDWWYAPGGGWDHAKETMLECATREAFEETGIRVRIQKFLYAQTLCVEEKNSVWLEHFWLADPAGNVEILRGHIDQHGVVEEARWFNQLEMGSITAFPAALRSIFWNSIEEVLLGENRYLGHSKT